MQTKVSTKSKKNCPRGYRRNKLTRECDKHPKEKLKLDAEPLGQQAVSEDSLPNPDMELPEVLAHKINYNGKPYNQGPSGNIYDLRDNLVGKMVGRKIVFI